MNKLIFLSFFLILFHFVSCQSNDESESTTEQMYFPPNNSDAWETRNLSELNWNQEAVEPLYNYLEETNAKSFIVLYNGKIVLEKYFDNQTMNSLWYWASAGKTLTATMVGIAQQQNYLNTNHSVSQYLGTGWTSATEDQENAILVKHLLTMTSGLDDSMGDGVSPNDLQYLADPGSRWAYHNVYVKLQDVIASATNQSYNDYFNTELRDVIGMKGAWNQSNNNNVYWSDMRSMARFGLLALNNGNWNGNQIVNHNYFVEATSTSQPINLSYGYLWWLNGKTSYHLPQTQYEFSGSLIPNAPNDMFCALGKNDQKIYVIPSRGLVICRMGNAADDENFGLSEFDTTLWEKINSLIN